ncbi:glycine decarboxylase subunit P, partial [Coemansia sp. RSA 1939]
MLSRSATSKAQSIARLSGTMSRPVFGGAMVMRAALLHTLKPRQTSAAAVAETSSAAATSGASGVSATEPSAVATQKAFAPLDTFLRRHVGPRDSDIEAMLKVLGFKSMDEMIRAAVPDSIRLPEPLAIADGEYPEQELLAKLKVIASRNKVYRLFIGTGYTDTVVPGVILRNVLENPGW